MQHLHHKCHVVRVYCMVFSTFYAVAKMCFKSKESRYRKDSSVNVRSFFMQFILWQVKLASLIAEKNNSTQFVAQTLWDRLHDKVGELLGLFRSLTLRVSKHRN